MTPVLNELYAIYFPGIGDGFADIVRFKPPVDAGEAKRVMVEEKGWSPYLVVRGLDD